MLKGARAEPRPNGPEAGLVSVTFRKLSPAEIVALVREEKLEAIEWGGDVHVPPGEIARAKEVAAMTRDAGLRSAAYGSYYRLGIREEDGRGFESVLATAVALDAPVIRVWAGRGGSDAASEADKDRVWRDGLRVAEMAAAAGLKIGIEFHANTLHDTPAAARELLGRLEHPNIFSLWQPLPSLSAEEQEDSLIAVLPRLCHVHVYHCLPGVPFQLRPLAGGANGWRRWPRRIAEAGGGVTALLEFVRGDSVHQFRADALALREILAHHRNDPQPVKPVPEV